MKTILQCPKCLAITQGSPLLKMESLPVHFAAKIQGDEMEHAESLNEPEVCPASEQLAKTKLDLSEYPSDQFDTAAMETDAAHGNFSPEFSEDYRHENIVQASFINGQFTQARNQCQSYGLDYEGELARFKTQ